MYSDTKVVVCKFILYNEYDKKKFFFKTYNWLFNQHSPPSGLTLRLNEIR